MVDVAEATLELEAETVASEAVGVEEALDTVELPLVELLTPPDGEVPFSFN